MHIAVGIPQKLLTAAITCPIVYLPTAELPKMIAEGNDQSSQQTETEVACKCKATRQQTQSLTGIGH
eukprot:1161286-Pelagomonas_calceolata.AAC.6